MLNAVKVVFVFIFFFLGINSCFAFNFKKLNPFKKKKQPAPKAKMVETKQEWMIEAQNIPLEERKEKEFVTLKSTKEFHYPDTSYKFEKYNYPQGKREINIQDVIKKGYLQTYITTDINCKWGAYSIYYFSPDNNQISSNFYVEKLDTSKIRTKRILEYNHNQLKRTPVIEAGTKEIYPNLFKGLTLVDWSNDGEKLLIKEKVGSMYGGIYKTYLYVHFMETDIENPYTIKLTDFDEAIKNYYLDYQKLQIVKYKYDIEPLGFSADDDDVIVANCFIYDDKNNKIFLGLWGYDCSTRETFLISKTDPSYEISANGLILRQKLD